jgi:hypothetical protein
MASAEVRILKSVLDDRTDEAREALEDFFPSELNEFARKVEELSNLIDTVLREKSAR